MRESSWGAPGQARLPGLACPGKIIITGCEKTGGLRVLAEPHRRDIPRGGVPWQI
jgi:hypothetical protein